MIFLNRLLSGEGTAKCDEDCTPQCPIEHPVKLTLGLMGGIMFEPPAQEGWQMIVRRPGQPVRLLCPAHNRKVSTSALTAVPFRKP